MRDFKRGDDKGGFSDRGNRRPSFGGGRKSFGGGDRGDRPRSEMHDAVCDECKQECQVPFRPTSDKPVYCRDCFDKRGGSEEGRGGRRDSRFSGRREGGTAGSNDGVKKQLEEMNSKLDTLIRLLGSKE